MAGLKLRQASFKTPIPDSAVLTEVLPVAKHSCEWQEVVTGWGWWPWLNNLQCIHAHTHRKWSSLSAQLRKALLPKWTINAWKKSEKWISLWPFEGLSFSWHTHYLKNQMCLSKHYSDVWFGHQRSDSWPLTRWQWSIQSEILSLSLFILLSISALPATTATFCCWGAFKPNNNPI